MVVALDPNRFRNSYELSHIDLVWLERNIHNLSPIKVIRYLTNKWFDDSKKPKDKIGVAISALEYTKDNFFNYYADNPIDRHMFKAYMEVPSSESDKSLRLFSDLWRGYTDDDIRRELDSLGPKRTLIRTKIRSIDKKINRRIKRHKGLCSKYKYYKLRRDFDILKSDIEPILANKSEFAKALLVQNVNERRAAIKWGNKSFWMLTQIERFEPSIADFPLKHLMKLPASFISPLLELWSKSKDRNKIIEKARDTMDWKGFFDSIIKYYALIEPHLLWEYDRTISELQINWQGNRHISTTLLAIVTIEGILWSFADYLNKRNIRIYKKSKSKRHPYLWDATTGRYKDIDTQTKKPKVSKSKRDRLNSARSLMEKTRLKEYLEEDSFNFLVADFYDLRNGLMHGDFGGIDFAIEAPAALFALYGLLIDISKWF